MCVFNTQTLTLVSVSINYRCKLVYKLFSDVCLGKSSLGAFDKINLTKKVSLVCLTKKEHYGNLFLYTSSFHTTTFLMAVEVMIFSNWKRKHSFPSVRINSHAMSKGRILETFYKELLFELCINGHRQFPATGLCMDVVYFIHLKILKFII